MTKIREIYRCNVCGNIVEVLHAAGGTLVCCGQDMQLMEEQTKDSSIEKHVPYIEKIANGYKVKVGQNQEHPMSEKHWIEWIQLIADGESQRKFLDPDDKPEAEFETKAEKVSVREYCNIHYLWKS